MRRYAPVGGTSTVEGEFGRAVFHEGAYIMSITAPVFDLTDRYTHILTSNLLHLIVPPQPTSDLTSRDSPPLETPTRAIDHTLSPALFFCVARRAMPR